jgi:hypothetical protein
LCRPEVVGAEAEKELKDVCVEVVVEAGAIGARLEVISSVFTISVLFL